MGNCNCKSTVQFTDDHKKSIVRATKTKITQIFSTNENITRDELDEKYETVYHVDIYVGSLMMKKHEDYGNSGICGYDKESVKQWRQEVNDQMRKAWDDELNKQFGMDNNNEMKSLIAGEEDHEETDQIMDD
mmetsp:Transcript_28441/g.25107  ORF Transcript_28441/g.25107 Transcript_28441/m.25107 type:complete len:132 (-) Transcript_28441:49-444(-)|eukprot:CAMPEP_0201582620 /NCGR_PEP_ID=MMETSP0190_2-20130828/87858_1 /ASSEMBLY_ACC=CAM_ASM_000263 /TAXON_ID=37353 /ORGANISM="Rosalina sp." /LENGTH=131 /DNA_ID=CAMNT_0048022881 /DNA_START=61 /DNA_END=456 /DNA_ORIENTATION=-